MPNKWLDYDGLNHFNKNLKKYYSRMNAGSTLTPIYIGDYLSYKGLPSVVLRMADMFYCVNAYNEYGDMGKLYVFDHGTNTHVQEQDKDILCGHANSICYNKNNGRIYISPVFTYPETGDRQEQKLLYVFDSEFNYIKSLAIDRAFMGISFDSATNTMYGLTYANNLYKFDENTELFTLYCTINRPSNYSQDIAIYNNYLFLSSPQGQIDTILIENGNAKTINHQYIVETDNLNHFERLGELEGFEFYNGHLIAIMYTNYNDSEYRNAFIVEIPVGFAIPEKPSYLKYSRTDYTINISQTIVDMFSLPSYGARSLSQVMNINFYSRHVQINDNIVEPVDVYITKDIRIVLNGNYTCNALILFASYHVLETTTENRRLTFNSAGTPINLSRAGILEITGRYSIYVSNPNASNNNFIGLSYDAGVVLVLHTPISIEGRTFKITGAGSELSDRSVWFGTSKLH